MTRANRLLIIDDDTAICELFAAAAQSIGFESKSANSAAEVLASLRQFAPTAVILDLQMADADGIELLKLLSDQQCNAKVLVVSGGDKRVLAASVRFGTARGLRMAGALRKPLRLQQLQTALSDILRSTWTADELSVAIDRGELSLRYQPKLARRSATGAWVIDGAEALLRWPHPVHGTIMPGEFLPVAEQAGLMLPLTDFVLHRTLEQVQVWQSRGLELSIAVNVPPNLLTDEEFPDRLCACLSRYGVESSRFVLEITELATSNHNDLLVDVLSRLRLKGVQISIDDFGSGFASLERLLYLPFNELKIDGSFISELDGNREARKIVGTIIELAHRLGMTACAERVETQEAFAFLEAQGCDRFQGHLISEPLKSLDFGKFMLDWSSDVVPAKLLPSDEKATGAFAMDSIETRILEVAESSWVGA